MSHRNLSLAQHLKNGQLPMFMTAGEILKHTDLGDASVLSTTPVGQKKAQFRVDEEKSTLEYKLREAKVKEMGPHGPQMSLHEDIAKNGVKEPLLIYDRHRGQIPMLWNGHHRLASAKASRPNDFLPLEHIN